MKYKGDILLSMYCYTTRWIMFDFDINFSDQYKVYKIEVYIKHNSNDLNKNYLNMIL